MTVISSASFCAAYKYVISLWSDDLEQEEFQVIGFRHRHEDGMVRCLLAEFNLP